MANDVTDMQRTRSEEQVPLPERDLAQGLHKAFERFAPIQMRGRVNRAVGTLVNASGVQAHLGEICELRTPGEPPLLAEVVGFAKQNAILTPLGNPAGISTLTEVVPSGRSHTFVVAREMLGRVAAV